jgi:hypothetical protein
MRMRWRARSIVALILLLCAAYSFYVTCLCKRPPLPLLILNERVILEGFGKKLYPVSLSPKGRHLLFLQREALQPQMEDEYHPFLLDLATGEQFRLPFQLPLVDWFNLESVAGAFTSDGNYIQVVHPSKNGQGTDWIGVFLYDIRNRDLRAFKVGAPRWGAGDDRGENLLVTTQDLTSSGKLLLGVVPMAEGAVKWHPLEGLVVLGSSRNDKAIVLAEKPTPDVMAFRNELSVVDLPSGKTLKTIRLHTWGMEPVFWTADGRFLCYSDCHTQLNFPAQVLRIIGGMPTFIKWNIEKEDAVFQASFWDSANDRLISSNYGLALGPGPSPSSVVLTDLDGPRLGVLDLNTGQEFRATAPPIGIPVCAHGKYVVYQVRKTNGVLAYELVEIGLGVRGNDKSRRKGVCHSRERGNPESVRHRAYRTPEGWIPAFAGMTANCGETAGFTGTNPADRW